MLLHKQPMDTCEPHRGDEDCAVCAFAATAAAHDDAATAHDDAAAADAAQDAYGPIINKI